MTTITSHLASTAPVPESPIDDATNRVFGALATTDDMISQLESRIEKVLGPAVPSPSDAFAERCFR